MTKMNKFQWFEIKTYIENRNICNKFSNWMDRSDDHFIIRQTFNFYGRYWEEIFLQCYIARTPNAKTYYTISLFSESTDTTPKAEYEITDAQHKKLSDMMYRLWGE